MKKLIFLCFLLALPCLCYGQGMQPVGGVTVAAAGASCDSATNEVGDRSVEASANSDSGFIGCFVRSADCSGTLGHAFFYSRYSSAAHVKVGIFNKTSTTPVIGDTLIGGWSTSIAAGGDSAWNDSGGDLTGSVTSSTDYWICYLIDSTPDFDYSATNSATLYYRSSTQFASPPSTLTGTWSNGSYAPVSTYVQIK
jgi:hypothetical protein